MQRPRNSSGLCRTCSPAVKRTSYCAPADGSVIAMAPAREMHAPAHADETSPALIFRLPDGRSVTTHATIEWPHPLSTLVLCLSVLALAVGVGAYPIVRPLTRRLERLQAGVESLGAGT